MQKESLLFYTDGLWDGAIKTLKANAKDALTVKKIKWKTKKSKEGSFIALAADSANKVEKELLKSKADRYILAIGLNDLWDNKAKGPTELSIDDIKSSMSTVIDALQSAGRRVIVCTPYPLFEETDAVAKARLSAAAEMIRMLAADLDVTCCDVHKSFVKTIAKSDPAKKGKGITTKNGVKLNKNGEAILARVLGASLALSGGATLNRELTKGDVINFASPYRLPAPMKKLSLLMKAHYKDAYGVIAPRGVDTKLESRFFTNTIAKLIEFFKISRSSILIISPGNGDGIMGDRAYADSLESGLFKERLSQLLDAVRAEMNVELFVCTPLVWCEAAKPQKIDVEGANYKTCQLWADQVREVAESKGVALIDIHQKCVDYIDEHGADALNFAGHQPKDQWYEMDYKATDFVMQILADTVNFPFSPKP
ncbi:MAG: hypothetical protein HRU15_01215 [Planctomycetes bacterium]|nr:hypothetical protein [Planctomycetota bacterium]